MAHTSVGNGDDTDKVYKIFKEGIQANYLLGIRMQENPLFKESSVQKFKSKLNSTPSSNARAGSSSSPRTRAAAAAPVDTIHDIASPLYEFYNSWPERVTLESGEDNVCWTINLPAKNCLFCGPKGKCNTLNELLDHLNNCHHTYFKYSVRRTLPDKIGSSGGNAIIRVYLRDIAVIKKEIELNRAQEDPAFRVDNEGYFLSARLRQKYPKYSAERYSVPKTTKSTKKGNDAKEINFPFVIRRTSKPEETNASSDDSDFQDNVTGRAVPHDSNPGRHDKSAVPSNKNKKSSSASKQPVKKGRSSRASSLTNEGTHYPTLNLGTNSSNTRKKKKILTKRRPENPHSASGAKMDSTDTGASKSAKQTKQQRNGGRKRKLQDAPDGKNNPRTQFIRTTLFGEDPDDDAGRNVNNGKGVPLTAEAAREIMFHSVSNEPLDLEKYAAGYDSDAEDGGAEKEWRLRMADWKLSDMADMCPVEVYFFNLWNQFMIIECSPELDVDGGAVIEGKEQNLDRALFSVWMSFVRKYGGEIKRMKMEAVLAMNVVHCWELALIDAQGLHDIAMEFKKNSKVGAFNPKIPHSDFLYAHRMLREEEMEKKGMNRIYEGYERCKGRKEKNNSGVVKEEEGDDMETEGDSNTEMETNILRTGPISWLEKEAQDIEQAGVREWYDISKADEDCVQLLNEMELSFEEFEEVRNHSISDGESEVEKEESDQSETAAAKKENKNRRKNKNTR